MKVELGNGLTAEIDHWIASFNEPIERLDRLQIIQLARAMQELVALRDTNRP